MSNNTQTGNEPGENSELLQKFEIDGNTYELYQEGDKIVCHDEVDIEHQALLEEKLAELRNPNKERSPKATENRSNQIINELKSHYENQIRGLNGQVEKLTNTVQSFLSNNNNANANNQGYDDFDPTDPVQVQAMINNGINNSINSFSKQMNETRANEQRLINECNQLGHNPYAVQSWAMEMGYGELSSPVIKTYDRMKQLENSSSTKQKKPSPREQTITFSNAKSVPSGGSQKNDISEAEKAMLEHAKKRNNAVFF